MLTACTPFLIRADGDASLSHCDSCASFYTTCMSKFLFVLMQVHFSATLQKSLKTSRDVDGCVCRMWVFQMLLFLFKISERHEKDGQNSVFLPVLSDNSC